MVQKCFMVKWPSWRVMAFCFYCIGWSVNDKLQLKISKSWVRTVPSGDVEGEEGFLAVVIILVQIYGEMVKLKFELRTKLLGIWRKYRDWWTGTITIKWLVNDKLWLKWSKREKSSGSFKIRAGNEKSGCCKIATLWLVRVISRFTV